MFRNSARFLRARLFSSLLSPAMAGAVLPREAADSTTAMLCSSVRLARKRLWFGALYYFRTMLSSLEGLHGGDAAGVAKVSFTLSTLCIAWLLSGPTSGHSLLKAGISYRRALGF